MNRGRNCQGTRRVMESRLHTGVQSAPAADRRDFTSAVGSYRSPISVSVWNPTNAMTAFYQRRGLGSCTPVWSMQHGAMAPVRILIVEDEPLIRLFVADVLSDAGYQVEEAANAAEASKQMRADDPPFDAVIIDVGLPDKRGDVLADEVRATWNDLPVVIATGHDKQVIERRFASDGRVRVLGKPYYGDMLLDALRAMGVSAAGA